MSDQFKPGDKLVWRSARVRGVTFSRYENKKYAIVYDPLGRYTKVPVTSLMRLTEHLLLDAINPEEGL